VTLIVEPSLAKLLEAFIAVPVTVFEERSRRLVCIDITAGVSAGVSFGFDVDSINILATTSETTSETTSTLGSSSVLKRIRIQILNRVSFERHLGVHFQISTTSIHIVIGCAHPTPSLILILLPQNIFEMRDPS
jgi:hypothetical protein